MVFFKALCVGVDYIINRGGAFGMWGGGFEDPPLKKITECQPDY